MSTMTAALFGDGHNATRRAAPSTPETSLALDALEDAVDVAAEGRAIDAAGVPYLVDGIVPAYGMLGFLVAYTKVGKTTFGQSLAGHVAQGLPFLGRTTTPARVLIIAAEDPPEYTAWLARHLDVPRGRLLFYRRGWLADSTGLAQVAGTVRAAEIGFVLIASWQAVVRGLVRDENDNAGAVAVVEAVKLVARETAIPWLIDAHSGKGEDQGEDADPTRAMRGASGAAGAADYLLSLRYANGSFGTQRRLTGKGRFVSLPTITFDYDTATSAYTVEASSHDTGRETTWQLLVETGAITTTPQALPEIARRLGWVEEGKRPSGGRRKHLSDVLHSRPEVLRQEVDRRGQKTWLFALAQSR